MENEQNLSTTQSALQRMVHSPIHARYLCDASIRSPCSGGEW